MFRKILLTVLLFFTSASFGESATFGDYTIHYQAVNSTFLTPEIAEQYAIVRSDRRGFLNISILRNEPDGATTAVPAAVSGSKNTLLGQSEPVEFREIREGEAIYYIGEFQFANAQNLRFDLEVQPESAGDVHAISWNTQLYRE